MRSINNLNKNELVIIAGGKNKQDLGKKIKPKPNQKCNPLALQGCFGKCDMDTRSLVDWHQLDEMFGESPWLEMCKEGCVEKHCKQNTTTFIHFQ